MYFTVESLRRDGPLHIVEFSIDLKSHKDAVPASVGAFVYLTGEIIERLIITLTSCCSEFLPCDQVSPLLVISLFIISTNKLVVSRNFLSIRIVLSCFYLPIFYFEKIST